MTDRFLSFWMFQSPASLSKKKKEVVSEEELVAYLEAHGDSLDYDDLLPLTLQLKGRPMDVKNRRPMFSPLFRKERKTKREIYLCGRQLGKTSSVAASILMNMMWRLGFSEMFVAPLALFTQKLHHDYMGGMVQSNLLPWKIQDKRSVSNVNQKTFATDSKFLAVSCFNSPKNAIGSMVDSLRFDEVQDLNVDFIPQILETLRMSEHRWVTYTGTARGVENTIQTLFDESSGGEWRMRCDCKAFGRDIIMTRELDAIKSIQHKGICCPDCSRLIDVRAGEWIHRYPDRLDPEKSASPFAGYHIPATIVYDAIYPRDRYLETIYDKLHGIRPYSEARFLQEILGISSDQGGRPITPDEIKDVSVLDFNLGRPGITADEIRKNFRPSEYLEIAGGADWGGSEHVSFTVGSAVGYHHTTGVFHCLGAIRPTGLPDNERHFPLAAFYRRLGVGVCKGIGADAGFVGSVQNRNLMRISGIKTLSIAYGTKKLFYQLHPGNNAVVDRTTLIWIVYQLLKDKKLLLPKGVDFEIHSSDLLATYIEETEAPNGVSIRRYCRYKQRADDFLHSLGYAIFVCALMRKIDLPGMIGLQPRMSANAGYLHLIGEEGDKSFGMNDFSS